MPFLNSFMSPPLYAGVWMPAQGGHDVLEEIHV